MTMGRLKTMLRSLLPAPLVSAYHLALAYLGALLYGFPSRRLLVIAITGTKGKSSTSEYINAILEAAGHTTALINSIQFKTADRSMPNTLGRSTPGRFFIQAFLRDACRAGCSVAILEMTSEGARQHRHRALAFDALVFTNLAPEHIESHGSLEAYKNAKFEIARALMRSPKRPRIIVANANDAEGARYLALPVERSIPFSLDTASPYEAGENGGFFTLEGARIDIRLPGTFSLENALAAAQCARALGIDLSVIARGLGSLRSIPGRAESIDLGQDFLVVVDYAHTPESQEALYTTYDSRRKICVFGSAGGGRDTWKRPIMGRIAERYCSTIILTDDETYDEDPNRIIADIASGMKKTPEVIRDRRAAIRRALELAQPGDAVLISGMGVHATMRRPDGSIEEWNDVEVARSELENLLNARAV